MRIEVINTGTELLLGKVTNSHLAFFGTELFKLGLRIDRQICIPDGDEIRLALIESFPRTDAVLVTGGLGPTSDDITREIVAELLGRSLHEDQDILDYIEEIFRSRNLVNNPANARQAMVPEGAEVLHNPNGTAPGLYLPATTDGYLGKSTPHIFLLPGPPRELKPMFIDQVMPRLSAAIPASAKAETFQNFRIFGVGESTIGDTLQSPLDEISGLEVGYCARLGEVDVRLIGDLEAVTAGATLVRATYPRQIVTESEDSIEEVLVQLLLDQQSTVSTAESCTGGAISSAITNVSGSSEVFHRGFVTYANEAKTELLGVPADLIAEYGAVSEPVARAMAEGCRAAAGSTHAIAVTGIAGPTGGSAEKPVGTVYIAIASEDQETFVRHHITHSDRFSFKLRVTRLALDLLRQRLLGYEPE